MTRRLLVGFALTLLVTGCAHDEQVQLASGRTKMGISYLHSQNYTEALRYFLEAEKLNPDDPELQNALGLAYFYKNEFELAVGAYQKAVALKPDFSEAWNNLGVAQARLGRFDDAVRSYDKALENLLYETPESALLNKGDVFAARFDYVNAVKAYEKAVAVAQSKPDGRLAVCLAYAKQGHVLNSDKRYVEAVRQLQQATKLCPKMALPHFYLSTSYTRLGRKNDAVRACQTVQSLAPGTEEAQACANYVELLKPNKVR